VFVAGNATILHADLDACWASVEQRNNAPNTPVCLSQSCDYMGDPLDLG
jgi:nucleotidyltransferase/DNA polymerase involved in DNA repair